MLHSLPKSKILYQVAMLFSVLTLSIPCYAGVIFEDNFDNQPDWNASGQVEGRECITTQSNCSAADYPVGYNFFRAMKGDASLTSPPSIRRLPGSQADHSSSGTGKAFIVYNHSANGTWPGDGYIGKYFNSATYPELYVRFWIRTQAGWQDMAGTPQSKILRMGSWNGGGNAFSWDTPQAPAVFFDWGAYAGYAAWISAYRCDGSANTYYCSNSVNGYQKYDIFQDWGVNQTPTNKYADTGWHRYDIHIKYNSAPGVADGIYEFKYDGVNIAGNGSSSGNYPETNVVLREAGSTKTGFNIIAIGGNSNNKWNTSPAREQWYAIDDFVVSTTPIPDNYVIGGGSAADTTAPTVSISSPANNATVSGTVSVTANASDSVGVSKVEYYVNGALSATDSSTPYVYSWNTSSLANGTYTLMAKAYDAAGNAGQSSTVSVSVVKDTILPTVSLTSPANNATISGTVAIAASAADNVGVSRVEFYGNGALLSASNVTPYSYNLNTTALANGAYALTAKAFDAAGNVGQSAAVSVTVNNAAADTTAPTASIVTPAANASVTGTVTFTASASDNVGVSMLEYYRNGVLVASGSVAPYTYKWDTTLESNGAYSFIVKAYDAAGNVGQSATNVITVNNTVADTTAPSSSVTSPVANASVSGLVTIAASASDNVGVSKVEFYVNSALKATATAAPYSFNWDSKSVVNGSYSLTTKAFDAAGNAGQSAAVSVTVNNPVADTTAPTASITTPAANASVTGTVTFTASASDNVGVSMLEYYRNGVLVASGSVAPYTYKWDTTLVSNGAYTFIVKAYDAAGNVGQSATNVITVNNTVADTTAPTASIATPAANASVTGTVTFTANASDNVGVSMLEYYRNGVLVASGSVAPYTYKWDTTLVSNGAYSFIVKSYDAAGNVGQSSAVTVTVNNYVADLTAPVTSITYPLANATVRRTVSITAAATDNVGVSRVEYYINGILKATDTATPYSYSWNTKSVANGIYTLTTKAYDAAGNVKQSVPVNVNVKNYLW